MKCDDCYAKVDRVFIPIPVNTRKPKVCLACAKERERKWGHTYMKGTGKWAKTGYTKLVNGHMIGVNESA